MFFFFCRKPPTKKNKFVDRYNEMVGKHWSIPYTSHLHRSALPSSAYSYKLITARCILLYGVLDVGRN